MTAVTDDIPFHASQTGRAGDGAAGGGGYSCLAAGALALVVIFLVSASQFIAQLDDAVLDDDLFAHYGWAMTRGATLYTDLWDHKPPGVFWLNHLVTALWSDRGGILILCASAQYAALALLYAVAWKLHGRRAAAVILLLGAVYMTNAAFHGGSNRAETFFVPCELGFILIYLWAWRRGSHAAWILAGACAGMALLMKQTGGAVLAAAGAHLAWTVIRREIDVGTAILRYSLVLVGVLILGGACFAVLYVQGASDAAVAAVFTANRAYLAIDNTDPFGGAWWWVRLERSSLWLLKLPLMLAVGSVAIVLQDRCSKETGGAPREAGSTGACPRPMSLLFFWLTFAVVGALAGPISGGHYMQPALPPLLLLGGFLIARFCRDMTKESGGMRRVWCAAAIALAVYLAWDPLYAQAQKATVVAWSREICRRDGQWHMALTSAELVGCRIAGATEDDDRILSWDYLPGVLRAAKRPPASRFPSWLHFKVASQSGIAANNEFWEALSTEVTKILVMTSATWHELSGMVQRPFPDGRSLATYQLISRSFVRRPDLSAENILVFTRRPTATNPS